jgi:type I restriction enzyme, S subunit
MTVPRHKAYKNSGAEWLGEVPDHWTVKRLKHVCKVFPSNVDKKTYENEPTVLLCNYTDVYYNERITRAIVFMTATASTEQVTKFTLRAGDTVITKDSETADDIAIAAFVPQDLPGVICGYHLSIVRPREGTWGAFVKRLFDSSYVKARVAVAANGLTRVGLSQYALDNVEIPFPPKAEQIAIASFLESETEKVDTLITEQQRLIELLEEKGKSAISHAVTKGLNANALMKDSGIEWLGELPTHWRLMTLSRVSIDGTQNGVYKPPAEHQPNGVPCISMGEAFSGRTINIEGSDRVALSDDETARYSLSEGDLLFARRSLVFEGSGKCSLVGKGAAGQVFESSIIRVRLNREYLLPDFALLFFSAPPGRYQMLAMTEQTTISGINSQKLRQSWIPIPPVEEQRHICEYIHGIDLRCEALIAESDKSIALLRERRTALISAAITGKIDARSVDATRPETEVAA